MTTTDLVLRLFAALAVGVILGLEREKRGRAAGLRTTTLVAVAAALAMVLSEWLPSANSPIPGTFGGDPGRLAAGVLAGMGFLGAGVIIRQDTAIRGVTTAAVLWITSILGLCAGSGNFGLCFSGTAIVLFILLVLPYLEMQMDNDGFVTLTVLSNAPGLAPGELEKVLEKHHLRPLTTSVLRGHEQVTFSVHLTAPKRDSIDLPRVVTSELMALPTVTSVNWVG